MKKTLAVLEGDGIGPEIMREGIKALRTIEKKIRPRICDRIRALWRTGVF